MRYLCNVIKRFACIVADSAVLVCKAAEDRWANKGQVSIHIAAKSNSDASKANETTPARVWVGRVGKRAHHVSNNVFHSSLNMSVRTAGSLGMKRGDGPDLCLPAAV